MRYHRIRSAGLSTLKDGVRSAKVFLESARRSAPSSLAAQAIPWRRSFMSRLLLASVSLGLVATAAWLSPLSDELRHEPTLGIELRAFGPLHPRLAPAGDRIVFSCQAAIWTLPAAGGTMTRLTSGDGFDSEPVWSPHTERIAYLT